MNKALFLVASIILISFPVSGHAETPAQSSETEAEAGPSPQAHAALEFALDQRGKPYQFGATGPDSYDASGLAYAAWKAAGITLPRSSSAQYEAIATKVSRDQLLPGDLVFLSNRNNVGIYVGNDTIVHSPSEGDVVKISPIGSQYAGAVRPG